MINSTLKVPLVFADVQTFASGTPSKDWVCAIEVTQTDEEYEKMGSWLEHMTDYFIMVTTMITSTGQGVYIWNMWMADPQTPCPLGDWSNDQLLGDYKKILVDHRFLTLGDKKVKSFGVLDGAEAQAVLDLVNQIKGTGDNTTH